MPARQSGSPRQQCIGVIPAFVDSIDSQIILRIICESKRSGLSKRIKINSRPGRNFGQAIKAMFRRLHGAVRHCQIQNNLMIRSKNGEANVQCGYTVF